MAAVDYPQMLAMVDSGILLPDLLVERTVGLTDGIANFCTSGDPDGSTVGGDNNHPSLTPQALGTELECKW